MSYYADSRGHYSQKHTTIIQSRGSSADSHASSSRSSTDRAYTSKSTMANPVVVAQKHRVPDNDRHYIETRKSGNLDITHHEKAIYDKGAPLASQATYEDYKRTERRATKAVAEAPEHRAYGRDKGRWQSIQPIGIHRRSLQAQGSLSPRGA